MAPTLGDILRNDVAEALVDALADTLPVQALETLRNTLANVLTEELINALVDTQRWRPR